MNSGASQLQRLHFRMSQQRGEFSAIGVYNQFVFVDPSRGVVIVKLSANRRYGTSPDEATNREMKTIEFLRAVAAATE